MKHLALFLDGTWNGLTAPHPTNVVRLARQVAPHNAQNEPQLVYYDEGVGTSQGIFAKGEKFLGGAFGIGLMKNVEQAYRFLVFNYEPGDRIYVFGFSRGAYTARTLAGMIRNCGILERSNAHRVAEASALYRARDDASHPDEEKSCKFRAEFSPRMTVSQIDRNWRRTNNPDFDETSCEELSITYLGVWDTVGALGVPNHIPFVSSLFNKRHKFHDAVLSSMVQWARHALAIDERRQVFMASPWDADRLELLSGRAEQAGRLAAYLQQWFPGDHGSVGGGGDVTALSDGALAWIAEGAERAGLTLTSNWSEPLAPDPLGPLKNISNSDGFKPLEALTSKKDREGPRLVRDVSAAAITRWKANSSLLPENKDYRPGALKKVSDAID